MKRMAVRSPTIGQLTVVARYWFNRISGPTFDSFIADIVAHVSSVFYNEIYNNLNEIGTKDSFCFCFSWHEIELLGVHLQVETWRLQHKPWKY